MQEDYEIIYSHCVTVYPFNLQIFFFNIFCGSMPRRLDSVNLKS
jgi:hypothetical protein